MIQINQIEQQVSLTVNPITEVINIEVTEIIHSVYIVAKESPESPTFNQNNVDVVKTVQTLYSDEPLKWLSNLNELTPYTINEFQSLWVRVIYLNQSNVPDKTIIYKVINKGKGDYGLNKTQFILEDLFFVAQSAITLQDIINEETTIVINLREHTSHVIKDVVNSQNPPILIQNQALGQTIFTVLDDEIVYSYLWIGTAGTYGVGSLASVEADFQLITNQSQITSNLYIEKETFSPLTYTNTGVVGSIEIGKQSAIKITGTVSELGNIVKNNPQHYYPGQLFALVDDTTSGNIKLPHMYTTGGSDSIAWFHSDAQDYYTKKNEIVLFALDFIGSQKVYRRISSKKQFNDTQEAALLALIYENSISTISLSSTSGERGATTSLTVSYNIQTRDDVFTAASINQGIGSVLANINSGTKTVSGGTATQNKTFTLSLGYTRNGVATTETKSATYTTYVPQFAGVSTETDFADLAAIIAESNLQKFIQASASINKQSSPTDQYIWFVSTKNNAAILDQNNFSQSVGTWGDGVSEFYRKSLVITLVDGTTETVYLYRTRNVKTLTNFTYKIS